MVWPFTTGPVPKAPTADDFMATLQGGPTTLGSRNDQSTPSKSQTATQYRFDSAALERAAKAAKELEKSPLADKIFELTKQQEINRHLELQKQIKEYEAAVERTKQEEQRRTLETQAKLSQQRSQYEDQLARRRYEDQLQQQQAHQAEQLRRQEESDAKREAMRKKTIEYESELRRRDQMNVIEAKARARAAIERENKEIYLEQIKTKAAENRLTTIESIKTAGSVIGSGFKDFITDWDRVKSTALGLTLFAGGIYSAKYSILIAGRAIEARIGKPILLQETSRLNAVDLVKHPLQSAKRLYDSRRPEDALKGVILRPSLEERLRDLAIATRNTKRNRGVYMNVMLYGPPGTGKTMFARKLAQHSGMDYAILSGGDVGKMSKEGPPALHKVFDWAETSRRGLLLFMDEADTFLLDRGDQVKDLRESVTVFLQRTGAQSNRVMIVLATNRPQEFDEAVSDRIDKCIEFGLPTLDERKRLVRLYFDKFVLQPASQKKRRGLKVDKFDYIEVCDRVASMIEGLSGREIAKLGAAWQARAFASIDLLLTEEMVTDGAREALEEHKTKVAWRAIKQMGIASIRSQQPVGVPLSPSINKTVA
ncbi:ATPase family AAA domain-containing protein 3-A, partial [Fragariocoptes setiger]